MSFFCWRGLFLSICMQINNFCPCLHSYLVLSGCGTCLWISIWIQTHIAVAQNPTCTSNTGKPISLHLKDVSQYVFQLISLLMSDHRNMSGPTICGSSSTGGHWRLTHWSPACWAHRARMQWHDLNHSTFKNDVPVTFVKNSGIVHIMGLHHVSIKWTVSGLDMHHVSNTPISLGIKRPSQWWFVSWMVFINQAWRDAGGMQAACEQPLPSMLLQSTCLQWSRGSRRLGRSLSWVMKFIRFGMVRMLGRCSHAVYVWLLFQNLLPFQTFFRYWTATGWVRSFAPSLSDLKGVIELQFCKSGELAQPAGTIPNPARPSWLTRSACCLRSNLSSSGKRSISQYWRGSAAIVWAGKASMPCQGWLRLGRGRMSRKLVSAWLWASVPRMSPHVARSLGQTKSVLTLLPFGVRRMFWFYVLQKLHWWGSWSKLQQGSWLVSILNL